MRILSCAVLLVLAGCTDDIAVNTDRPARQAPDPAAVCPGTDCWGMHPVDPKLECLACGVTGLVFPHLYCSGCAAQLDRCAHCGRKSPAKPPAPYKSETPAPQAPPKEKPREKPPEAPAPPPKAPEPKKEAASNLELTVEAVQLVDEADRVSHSVIVFAAAGDMAKRALAVHRTHKKEDIARLPKTAAGGDAGLYLVWGRHPEPRIREKDIEAAYDAKAGRIRITLPPLGGSQKDGGIGMDWGVDRDRTWPFVGFRVKLSSLPAGEYSFEVLEVEKKGGAPRELSKGTFKLD